MARLIRVGVVGLGQWGQHHVRVYHHLPGVHLAGVVDTSPGEVTAFARRYQTAGYRDHRQLLGKVDAVSLAVPTALHYEIAREFLKHGVHVLVEKPITTTVEQGAELIDLAQRAGVTLLVGHVERFKPSVHALTDLVTEPLFVQVRRVRPWDPTRATDVGVVLDLMIHDLDAVLSFVNSPVQEIRAAGLPILSDKVDIANARIEFESGCVANFTASRVSTERVRKLRFFQPHQYISLDYGRQDVLVFTVGSDQGTPSVNPEIKVFKPQVVPQEPLHAELQSFLHSVRKRECPVVPLEDGRRALAGIGAFFAPFRCRAGG